MVVEDKHVLGHESAGEVSNMTLTLHLDIHGRQYIIDHRCPSVRNASKTRRSRRDRARYSLPHLRAVSQGPLQRLRARALPFYTPHPRFAASLYRASGLVVPQAPSVPLL
jgi:hypothetical protein